MNAETFVTICLILTPLGLSLPAYGAENESRARSRADLDAVFNRQIDMLAGECANSNKELAEAIEHLKVIHDPSRLYFFVPQKDGHLAKSLASPADKKIASRLASLQSHYAKHLFDLADVKLQQASFVDAYRLLNEVGFHDPAHPIAGLVCDKTRLDRALSARPGRSVHAEFGWQPGQYSRIKSTNFFVTTNASQEAATNLVRQLEILNRVWRQMFFTCWSSGEQLENAWKRKKRISRNHGRHEIVLFANRAGYIRFMERIEPRARMTLGYYSIERKTAYFFLQDSDQTDFQSTWIHEATHQLFHETKRVNRRLTFDNDFWIIEGLALYLESLQQIGPCFSTGGIEADRLQFARYRRLIDDFFLPTSQLTAMGRDELQNHSDIRRLYSQSAGLTHFLIHGQNGKYRSSLLTYVNQVYSGRASARSLSATLNTSYSQLDEQYLEFLNVTDQQLLHIDSRARITNLALGNTSVTDRSVGRLSLADVRWLDLTNTKISDEGLRRLSAAQRLRQLSLQGTTATSQSIQKLANSRLLEELNIAHTRIDDSAIKTLDKLANLKLVLFDGSQVSKSAIQNSRFAN